MDKVKNNLNSLGKPKLKMREKLAYAVGDIASKIIYNGVSIYILFFWTEKAGINPAVAGIILLISRIFDGFTDIIAGNLVDKTKSKYGKARPYLLYLAVPLAIITAITFFTPSNKGGILAIIYAFITYNLTMTIYTGINIPYGVLISKMTKDQTERGSLGILRGFGAIIGVMIVSIFAPKLIEKIGYVETFGIFGIITVIFFMITFFGVKERVGNTEKSEDVPLKVGMQALFKNKPWILMLIGGVILFATGAARQSAAAYFAIYYLGDKSLISSLVIMALPGYVLGMAIASPFFKRLGKIKTSIYAGYLSILIVIVFFFLHNLSSEINLGLIYAYLFIGGIVQGISLAGFFAIVSDTIEYGEWKTGVRIEGLTYSAGSVGTKVGGGIGAAVVGIILFLSGYNASLNIQSENFKTGIEWLYLWIPEIGGFIYAIILRFNEVDKLYPQIIKDLEERKNK